MPTRAEIIEAVPRFLRPDRQWSGMCEAAAWNLCDQFTPADYEPPSFTNATRARLASRIEGEGFGPGGNWVWMSRVFNSKGGDDGHVAYHMPGGEGLLFMASASVTDKIGGRNLGFIDGPTYMRRFPNQKLEGWSWDHGGTYIEEEDPDMVKYTDQDKQDLQNALAVSRTVEGLLREAHVKLDNAERRDNAFGKSLQAVADKVSTLGITLGALVERSIAVIIEIGTREGKGGRSYGDLETRQVVYISEKASKWRDLSHETDPEGIVRKLASLGWAQRDIKWLSHADFIDAMREANETLFQTLNPLPWYLTGDDDPSISV